MLPTVGRIVHYHPGGGIVGPLPAIVVYVNPDQRLNLAVFYPAAGMAIDVPQAQEPTEGHWNWPPRLPADPRPEVPSSTAVDGL